MLPLLRLPLSPFMMKFRRRCVHCGTTVGWSVVGSRWTYMFLSHVLIGPWFCASQTQLKRMLPVMVCPWQNESLLLMPVRGPLYATLSTKVVRQVSAENSALVCFPKTTISLKILLRIHRAVEVGPVTAITKPIGHIDPFHREARHYPRSTQVRSGQRWHYLPSLIKTGCFLRYGRMCSCGRTGYVRFRQRAVSR